MSVSPTFKQAVDLTIAALVPTDQSPGIPDDSVIFMLTGWGDLNQSVPIYLLPKIDPRQAAAGGCEHCEYLGLWANSWPGYPEELTPIELPAWADVTDIKEKSYEYVCNRSGKKQ